MENYICINGKKAELTEEQMKILGIELSKASPFERTDRHTPFYYVSDTGKVAEWHEVDNELCTAMHNAGNYCTDKSLMEQRALHETLNRLLWRYSMEHNGDKIDWNDYKTQKYYVGYHYGVNTYEVKRGWALIGLGDIYFYSREIAENAIKEIVMPFVKAHPDFKWTLYGNAK